MAGGPAFGSVAVALEDSRAVWGFGWLESVMQDVRYALRGFRKAPGFALLVVGTIGAALGLNTTMFTVFNAYVLRPIAVHDPWALYNFIWYGKNGQGHRFTWAQYQELANRKSPFSEVIATESLQCDVEGRSMFGQLVSGNYFTMLGAGVVEGRPLLPRDASAPGAGAVMVMGYDAFFTLPSLTPDWRVFGFILLASVAATLVFGMAPAIQTTRSRLVEANRGDFSSDYRPARLRSVLLATQVAVCSLLFIVTAIVLRSQQRVTARSIGLDLNGIWDARMASKYQARAALRLAETPGVEANRRSVARTALWQRPPIGLCAFGQPGGGEDRVQPGFGGILRRIPDSHPARACVYRGGSGNRRPGCGD